MEATLTHQVMDKKRECGEPHALARSLASRGRAGRRARAHDMRVNGPPKSAPLRGRGYLLPFDWFLGCYLLRVFTRLLVIC
jgi:hypothetical protein